MRTNLWEFIDSLGSFESGLADKIKSLYFPLCNEVIMSSVSPDLHGDIKTNQDSFLLAPVSRIDLINSKGSRNFWVRIDKDKIWSLTGVSKDLKQIKQDKFALKAGLLWHKIARENNKIGLSSEILSFVPASGEPVEIMQVKLTNIASKNIKFSPSAAIPIYARSAGNLRDHRHVTSLLQRITLVKFGVKVIPTLVFDESGHKPNTSSYFVLGWDERGRAPQYIYPTQEMFCGDEGDLEAPRSILEDIKPDKSGIQGKEAMGALRFAETSLAPGESKTYIILMGITGNNAEIKNVINKFNSLARVNKSFNQTKDFWAGKSSQIRLSSGNPDFDNWFRWVSIQPTLRKIFGCSFLPDFDYGKGGRGWRDLWQDCLGLILNDPGNVRRLLINNFSGVRIDGSNATIIGKGEGEFISDRNNISRVWMDHGVWPLLTLDLYLNETGDFGILSEQTSYFRNHEVNRASAIDSSWAPSYGNKLKDSSGNIYRGSILEHLLIEALVQFFNVGAHNHVRLEGADWNDGLDLAGKGGEGVAFSAMYAHNLTLLSELLLKIGKPNILIAKELKILLAEINYNDVKKKQKILQDYFAKTKFAVSGIKVNVDTKMLSRNLKQKSIWMMAHIRKAEWLRQGFFNGYYDNLKRRVEGKKNNIVRMILTSQVFAILSDTAQNWQVEEILKNTEKYLVDQRFGNVHLNTDFRQEQHNLGRAFSFVYGDKENGAFFNHMVVMFAYSLYKRGFVSEGFKVLNSIYNMALDSSKSKIYPCLPEYFNLQGRGMYSYLTGSASWFLLTMITQVFGIKGRYGDLSIEPKLCSLQFKYSPVISINRNFAGKKLKITFLNPQKLEYGKYKIIKASLNSKLLTIEEASRLIIDKKTILDLPGNKLNLLNIDLR